MAATLNVYQAVNKVCIGAAGDIRFLPVDDQLVVFNHALRGVTLSGSVKPKLARFSPASKGCKWVSASVPVTPPSTPALGPKTLSILLGLAAASVSLATHSPNWDVVPAPSPGWVR